MDSAVKTVSLTLLRIVTLLYVVPDRLFFEMGGWPHLTEQLKVNIYVQVLRSDEKYCSGIFIWVSLLYKEIKRPHSGSNNLKKVEYLLISITQLY